jgi:hypothetical protein
MDGLQHLQGGRFDATDLAAFLGGETGDEMLDQARDIFLALAQRRHHDRKTLRR